MASLLSKYRKRRESQKPAPADSKAGGKQTKSSPDSSFDSSNASAKSTTTPTIGAGVASISSTGSTPHRDQQQLPHLPGQSPNQLYASAQQYVQQIPQHLQHHNNQQQQQQHGLRGQPVQPGNYNGQPGQPMQLNQPGSNNTSPTRQGPVPAVPPHRGLPEQPTQPQFSPSQFAVSPRQTSQGSSNVPYSSDLGSPQGKANRLREHDRQFQQRYQQSTESSDAQNQFLDLPPSEHPWAEWQIRRAAPSARFGHSANYIAARDGELFVMGGIRDMDILDDLWVIDTHMLTGYQLRTEGPRVGPRVGHAAITLGNAYIMFGGDTKIKESDPLDDNLYLLNTTTLKWTVAEPVGPRPSGRYGHSVANLGVKIYVFGGQVDDMFFDDMWMFDLTTLRSPSSRWEKIVATSPPPPPRTNHTVVTYQDKMYLFGGANGDLWYSDTWVFDPQDLSWTQLNCTGFVPAPCQGHAATIIDDVMYVFGGMSSEGVLIDKLFALKLSTRKWYTFENLGPGPSRRSGHSLTAFDGDKILVWGGTDESNTAFVLDASRINYPPDSEEIEAVPEVESPTSARSPTRPDARTREPEAVPAQEAQQGGLGNVPDMGAPAATTTSAQSGVTTERSTQAARNSMLFANRVSWSPQRAGGQNADSRDSSVDGENDDFQSAVDLNSGNNGSDERAIVNPNDDNLGSHTTLREPEFGGPWNTNQAGPGYAPDSDTSLNTAGQSQNQSQGQSEGENLGQSQGQNQNHNVMTAGLAAGAAGLGGLGLASIGSHAQSANSPSNEPSRLDEARKHLSLNNTLESSQASKHLSLNNTLNNASNLASKHLSLSNAGIQAGNTANKVRDTVTGHTQENNGFDEAQGSPLRNRNIQEVKLTEGPAGIVENLSGSGDGVFHKVNAVSDRTTEQTNSITSPLAAAGGAVTGAVTGAVGNFFYKGTSNKDEPNHESTPVRAAAESTPNGTPTDRSKNISSPMPGAWQDNTDPYDDDSDTNVNQLETSNQPKTPIVEEVSHQNLSNTATPVYTGKSPARNAAVQPESGSDSIHPANINAGPGGNVEVNSNTAHNTSQEFTAIESLRRNVAIASGRPEPPAESNLSIALQKLQEEFSGVQNSIKQQALESSDRIRAVEKERDDALSQLKSHSVAGAATGATAGAVAGVAAGSALSSSDATSRELPAQQARDFDSEHDILKKQHAEVQRSLLGERDAHENLKRDYQNILQQHEELSGKWEPLHGQFDDNVKALAAANTALEASRQHADSAVKRAEELTKQNAELKDELAASQKQVSQYTELEARNSYLENEVLELRSLADKSSGALNSHISQIVERWAVIGGVGAAGAAAGVAGSRAIGGDSQTVHPDVAHYQQLYEQHKNAYEQSTSELTRAHEDNARLKDELKNHVESFAKSPKQSDLDFLTQQHQSALREAQQKHDVTLRELGEQHANTKAQFEELKAEHQSSQAEWQQKHTGLQSDLNGKLQELTKKHADLESEYTSSLEFFKNQRLALEKTREELTRQKETNSRLENQLSEARLQSDPDVSNISMGSINGRQAELMIRDLRAQIIILEEEREELRDNLMKAKKAALTASSDNRF